MLTGRVGEHLRRCARSQVVAPLSDTLDDIDYDAIVWLQRQTY